MGSSRRRRHSPEQIIRKLREADRLLGEGQEVAVVAKQLEVSEQTLQRWRAQYANALERVGERTQHTTASPGCSSRRALSAIIE